MDWNDESYERMQELSEEGNQLQEKGAVTAALKKFQAALAEVPEPILEWSESVWINTAIGDCFFSLGRFNESLVALQNAIQGPEALGNPFIHLRLGQCRLELGHEAEAADELTRAFMGGGHEVFEEDDSRYFAFLKTKIKPPEGGWPDEKKKSKWKFW
ncbi:hypothetical protein [Aliikangiella sp. IMCC44632]